MPQRSFRLTEEALADLNRIADHLASLDRRPPNQTTALAWAVARGVDAIAVTKAQGERIPAGLHDQIIKASGLLRGLSDQLNSAGLYGSFKETSKHEADAKLTAEHKELTARVQKLEAENERLKAKPYTSTSVG